MRDDEVFQLSEIPDVGATCEDMHKAAGELAELMKKAWDQPEEASELSGTIPIDEAKLEEWKPSRQDLYLSALESLNIPTDLLKESIEVLKNEARRLADLLGEDAILESAKYPEDVRVAYLYLKSFGIDLGKIREAMEAFALLFSNWQSGFTSLREAFEELRKLAVDLRHKEAAGRSRKPPRRVPSPALSPPQRKYWINYKPRNRLPVKGRKKKTDRRAET